MNIFVAKLSYSTSEDRIREAFEAFGEVESVKIIFDREAGRSKGFGFVEMTNDDEANTAIEALDGSVIDERNISVKKALPRDASASKPRFNSGPRPGGGGGGGSRFGSDKPRGDRFGGGNDRRY